MEISKLIEYSKESSKYKLASDEGYWNVIWEDFIIHKENEFMNLSSKEFLNKVISEMNFKNRASALSCEDLGVNITVGNICYIDFGSSFINEAGYQHFGLIINIVNGKALVIPMTSNEITYKQGKSKEHLMRIGKIKGMQKASVLFLNDAKFINTARIIDVKAYIDPNGKLFHKIKNNLINLII